MPTLPLLLSCLYFCLDWLYTASAVQTGASLCVDYKCRRGLESLLVQSLQVRLFLVFSTYVYEKVCNCVQAGAHFPVFGAGPGDDTTVELHCALVSLPVSSHASLASLAVLIFTMYFYSKCNTD